MSKTETTSKVSLKLLNRKNLGRQASSPTAWEEPLITPSGLLQRLQMAITDYAHQQDKPRKARRPRRALDFRHNSQAPQEYKSDYKWQSQTMLKIETTSKMSLKLRYRINLRGKACARAQLSTLDTAHKIPHSLERGRALFR